MIRKTLALLALITLTACANVNLDTPISNCPREGGIGGTGDCATEQALL